MVLADNIGMIIDRITITGADDSVDPEQLVTLSEKYPFVEWGILVSKTSSGKARFPSENWLSRLAVVYGEKRMKLSAHICGRWVREILMGSTAPIDSLDPWMPIFHRIQINTHAELMQKQPNEFIDLVKTYFHDKGKQTIIQWDNVNGHELLYMLCQQDINAVPLFDMSHGAGILPAKWPHRLAKPNSCWEPFYCGYAGGLGPEHIQEKIQDISHVVDGDNFSAIGKDVPVWLDMETKVRSNNDSIFDLEKVEKVLLLSAQNVN